MDVGAGNLAFEMAITRAMSWHPSETGPSYEETRAQVRRELLAAFPAQEWQDISTAPKDRRVGLLIRDVEYIGRWEDDRYAQKPRPYWQHETFGRLQISDQRKEQPTMWRELRPVAVIAEERGT